jgi:hypothetical protein
LINPGNNRIPLQTDYLVLAGEIGWKKKGELSRFPCLEGTVVFGPDEGPLLAQVGSCSLKRVFDPLPEKFHPKALMYPGALPLIKCSHNNSGTANQTIVRNATDKGL